MEQESGLPPMYLAAAVAITVACFFFGIIIIPLLALIGLAWGLGALMVRSQY